MSEKMNCQGDWTNRRIQAYVIWFAVAVAVGAWGANTYGQTTPEVIWDGGSVVDDKYVTPENWNPDGAPLNSSNQFVQINDGSTALVQSGDAAEGAFLMLGMRPGNSGHLNISGGSLTVGEMRVGGRETINSNLADWTLGTFDLNGGGTGSVTQTGGDVFITYTPGSEPPIQSLYVGDAGLTTGNTANGTYTISGGTLTSGIAGDDSIVIGTGPGTVGAFNQSGTSTVTSTGFVTVGRAGATATYTLSGGTLNVGVGTAANTMNLRIGDGEYPTGVLSSTTSGTFTHTNGSVIIKNELSVGRQTGTGSYTFTGADSSISSSGFNVGASGTGTFTMGTTGGADSDESLTLLQSMSIGISATPNLGTGTFTLKSGTLSIGTSGSGTRVIAIGNETNGKGTFNQEGGVLTSTDLVQIGRNNSNQDNVYNMSGGTATAVRWFVGGGSGAGATSGKGTLNISGSSIVTCSENLNVAAGAAGGTAAVGVINMSGGTLNMTGGVAANSGIIAIGNGLGATGTLNHSGGTINNTNGTNAILDIGRNNASGTYVLSGTGVLNENILRMADRTSGTGTKSITFNGGTSTIGQLTLGNIGVMTVNGGTHTISNTAFSTGSTFTTNINLNIAAATHGTSAINVGTGATLTIGTSTTAALRTITKGGAGTLTITGAQSHFAGTTLVNSAGTINLNSDAGTGLGINANAGTTNFGAAQNLREINVSGGTVNIGANNVTTTGAVTVSAGTLSGTGTIDTSATGTSVTVSGTGSLAPGPSAGTLTMNLGAGSLDLSAISAGALKFELGAQATPSASDHIVLTTGSLNIGTLDFSEFAFTNLGGVGVGSYKLIDAASPITGSLGTASGSFGGFNATLVKDDTNFDILLNVTGTAGLLGDFNSDGKVDAGDYVTWRKNNGTNNALANDGGLGTPINQNHFNLWRQNFGNPPGAGSGLGGNAAVPEPGTIVLAIVGCLWFAVTRRSRRG